MVGCQGLVVGLLGENAHLRVRQRQHVPLQLLQECVPVAGPGRSCTPGLVLESPTFSGILVRSLICWYV